MQKRQFRNVPILLKCPRARRSEIEKMSAVVSETDVSDVIHPESTLSQNPEQNREKHDLNY